MIKTYFYYLIIWSLILTSAFPPTFKGYFAAITGAFAFSTLTLLIANFKQPTPIIY